MQQKQDLPEWVLPLVEEDEKQGIDGPKKIKSQNYQQSSNITRTRRIKPMSEKAHTEGKGCSESKKSVANAGMS
jgi:hypothetical protein